AYSSEKGAAFLDRVLYLPRAWTSDPVRRAGIPQELAFRNKVELAEGMLERAFEAGIHARWVLADSFYGRSHAFRAWLEERGRPYAVMVPKTNAVPLKGGKKKIAWLVERLGEGAFSEVSPSRDTGGRRPWQWPCLAADPEKGMRRWLLVRRSTDDLDDLSFYQAYGPGETTVEELVGVCQERWTVEECFAEGEVGLDHYEVRRWDSWHRHVTLCLLAHAFLGRHPPRRPRHRRFGQKRKKGDLGRDLIPPSVPEARKLILAMAAPKRRGRFLLGWSAWRRAHQAAAARYRAARRSQRHAPAGEGPPEIAAVASEEAHLTDEQWELVRPLLPPQRGAVGRPPLGHRMVLGGILWVARTGSSWREMPEEYGNWETAYRRHELWTKQGLWQRIL
ncbi:MAG TPA: IS701 family transposase, partial [Rubrobacter sp.]|nr:IS701 family transposase [Rubrobacter sp.]